MENNEREKLKTELKNEIKQELKAEILAEIKSEFKGGNYDFEAYKKDVTTDDIAKAKAFITTWKWQWFIPIVCWFTWGYDSTLFVASIDRGTLRVEYSKSMMRKMLFVIVAAIMFGFGINTLVFVDKWAIKDAIKNAEAKLSE